MIDLATLTIESAGVALQKKEFSARELTEAYLEMVHARNPELHAYLEIFEIDARKQAEVADMRRQRGEADLLLGIPLAVKDNIMIEGQIASAASKILATHRATYDATCIANLKRHGAIFLGRTNMDEFAHGTSTENSAYGPTKNPHDTTRVPGGSSGGSAAAVAANMALGGLGTDTGGSCRQPGALCGIVGFKPTYGVISRSGLIAMGSSLDQMGTVTKTVRDAEILFHAARGLDSMDATSEDYDAKKFVPSSSQTKRIGIPRKFIEKGLSTDVLNKLEMTQQRLINLGYDVHDVELPSIEYALPVYYIICPAEVSTNLARFDGMRYGLHVDGHSALDDYFLSRGHGFGKEARRRIMLGTYVLSHGYYDAYYNKARAIRQNIIHEFDSLFSGPKAFGTIMMPTTAGPAFKIGEKVNNPVAMYLEDIFTVTANIIGGPAVSVPSGFVEREGKQLPLGIQFMAPHFGEELMFNIAKDAEGSQRM